MAAEEVPPRVREDGEKARTLITSALVGEVGRRLYKYENMIGWNTTCTSCAAVLDSCIRETFRREQAEAKLAEVRQTVTTFLKVRGEDGTADLAEAIRQVLDREPLP